MSRDKRLNRTQEVIGSIPISSTNSFNRLERPARTRRRLEATERIALEDLRISLDNGTHLSRSVAQEIPARYWDDQTIRRFNTATTGSLPTWASVA